MCTSRFTTFVAAAVALIATSSHAQAPGSAPEPRPIPRGVMNGWIERYHPNVMTGDPQVNAVTIVADTGNRYVASVADLMPRDASAAIDSAFAATAAHNVIDQMAKDLVAGRLHVPAPMGRVPPTSSTAFA